ncbi:maleylacetate reductase [Tritonibacter horizontis]|jgi:alcohol dehydrogenase class IV|uniref:Maleylacetate reductase n=1 Tax=Tritonibacter horizontis TaxID=1768241 RepID=A0A132C0U8_9RHOB|nr:maleylacetate reductase [Tritonibacter horizontis]KUP94208.1 maleylacetate reductase [Tritonibacter horizontis]
MSKSIQSINGQKIRFGAGIRDQVSQEMEASGLGKALVLSTEFQAEMAEGVAKSMGAKTGGIFSGATMHTPVEVTEQAMEAVAASGADCVVAVGGGSTTGLGKAIALRTDLPQIVIPTTYAGSEATSILGQTENGVKTTRKAPGILPEIVLYDPELVASLPVPLTMTSGLNAIAHSAEGLYAKERRDEISRLAREGIRAMAKGLPILKGDPGNLKAREETLYGAWACGTVLGEVGMALHHKICHTLGGTLNLPHSETHAIILPHAIAYNEVEVPDLLAPIVAILGGDTPSQALWHFSQKLGAPRSLLELGVSEKDIDRIIEVSLVNAYWNPREISRNGLRVLLMNALAGNPPSSSKEAA